MRYQTTVPALEAPYVIGELPTGGAVTVAVYKPSDSSAPALTSNICTEIGATGIYKWAVSNITDQPTSFTEYVYIMTDASSNRFIGKFVLGGYPDLISSLVTSVALLLLKVTSYLKKPLGLFK